MEVKFNRAFPSGYHEHRSQTRGHYSIRHRATVMGSPFARRQASRGRVPVGPPAWTIRTSSPERPAFLRSHRVSLPHGRHAVPHGAHQTLPRFGNRVWERIARAYSVSLPPQAIPGWSGDRAAEGSLECHCVARGHMALRLLGARVVRHACWLPTRSTPV